MHTNHEQIKQKIKNKDVKLCKKLNAEGKGYLITFIYGVEQQVAIFLLTLKVSWIAKKPWTGQFHFLTAILCDMPAVYITSGLTENYGNCVIF